MSSSRFSAPSSRVVMVPPCARGRASHACTKCTEQIHRPRIGNSCLKVQDRAFRRGQLLSALTSCPGFREGREGQAAAMEPTITTKRRKPGYEPIFISTNESWTSGRFIDHFLV